MTTAVAMTPSGKQKLFRRKQLQNINKLANKFYTAYDSIPAIAAMKADCTGEGDYQQRQQDNKDVRLRTSELIQCHCTSHSSS